MAITDGHGNPNWTRDEVILALDLYFDCNGKIPGQSDPRVKELSELLRAFPHHSTAARKASFRNPDGVAFKLQNLRQVATGKGLGNVSRIDSEIWNELGHDPERTKQLAKLIRSGVDTTGDVRELQNIETRQVWVTAFWGFRPQESGFIGFTYEHDRDRFFENCNDGDLVLIYGTTAPETDPHDRKRALGFLEIKKEKVFDIERMSQNHSEWKKSKGKEDSWTFGVRVTRAWKIMQEIPIKHITTTDINVAVRGVLLEGQERTSALNLSVIPVNVFGENPITFEGEPMRMTAAVKGPKGLIPSFGIFQGERVDGVHYVYMLIASGPVATVLGIPEGNLGGKKLVKVGYSKNPEARCKTFNDALPKTFKFRWTLHPQTFEYPTGLAAREAEKSIHDSFVKFTDYQGGEFFLGDFEKMIKEFYLASGGAKIVGKTITKKNRY